MCEAITGITLATMAAYASAASAVVGVASTVAAQDAARKSANTQADTINANNAAEHMDAQRTEDQLAGATAEQMSMRAIEARKNLARIQTLNGEGGGGATGDRLANESAFNANQDQATIGDNFKKQASQLAFGGAAASRSAQSQMASIRQPSLLGTGLTIAGQGIGTYNDYQRTQPKTGPAPTSAS